MRCGYVGIKLVKCHILEPMMHMKHGGVAMWKSSVLDPWKVHSACTKGHVILAWNQVGGMKLIATRSTAHEKGMATSDYH